MANKVNPVGLNETKMQYVYVYSVVVTSYAMIKMVFMKMCMYIAHSSTVLLCIHNKHEFSNLTFLTCITVLLTYTEGIDVMMV